VALYDALLREYVLQEELTHVNSSNEHIRRSKTVDMYQNLTINTVNHVSHSNVSHENKFDVFNNELVRSTDDNQYVRCRMLNKMCQYEYNIDNDEQVRQQLDASLKEIQLLKMQLNCSTSVRYCLLCVCRRSSVFVRLGQ
jgi:hypothetical protein